MANVRRISELRDATERIRLNFLQTDLALCFTFADLLKTEIRIGDRDAAQRILVSAEKGHAAISRFLPYVLDVERRNEIARQLKHLRSTLDDARQQLIQQPESCQFGT